MKDPDWPGGRAAVDYYFIQEDGRMFKCTMNYEPYFYISCVVRPPWRTISSRLRAAFVALVGNNRRGLPNQEYEGVIYRIVRER